MNMYAYVSVLVRASTYRFERKDGDEKENQELHSRSNTVCDKIADSDKNASSNNNAIYDCGQARFRENNVCSGTSSIRGCVGRERERERGRGVCGEGEEDKALCR